MSIISRPRVLFLLGAFGALAACGADDVPPLEPLDARSPDASPDAPADATPTGMVTLGSREVCPREVAVDGDQLYWLERDVLVRSSIDQFSPEVVYNGVNGGRLRFGEGAVYWVGGWPVRLDLASRQARPLIASPVNDLEIIDGTRPIVVDSAGMRVAEVDAEGNLDDLYAVARDPLDGLGRSGHWLFFGRVINGGTNLEWLDAVDGTHRTTNLPGYISGAALSERAAVIFGRHTSGTFLRVIQNGADLGDARLSFFVSQLDVDGEGALYAVNEQSYALYRAPSFQLAPEWTQIDGTTTVQHVAGLATGAIVVTCSDGTSVYRRFYP